MSCWLRSIVARITNLIISSSIAVQSSGITDVNPVGVVAKGSQLVIGGITKGEGMAVTRAQLTNLIGAVFSSIPAPMTFLTR